MKTYARAVSLIGGLALILTPFAASAQINNTVVIQSQNQAVQWAMSQNPTSMMYMPQYACNGYYSYSPCQQPQYQYSYPQNNRQTYSPQTYSYSYNYPSTYYRPTSYSYPLTYTYPSYNNNYGYMYPNTYSYPTTYNYGYSGYSSNYGYDNYAYNSGNSGDYGYSGGYDNGCGCGYDSSGQQWSY